MLEYLSSANPLGLWPYVLYAPFTIWTSLSEDGYNASASEFETEWDLEPGTVVAYLSYADFGSFSPQQKPNVIR